MKIQNLKKEYKTAAGNVVALNGVSFDLPDKGMVFILGKSGSGKSTLLKLLAGIDTPSKGEIIFNGKKLSKFSPRQLDSYRNVYCGFVFQEYNLLPELSVENNIALALEMQGEKDTRERVHDALQRVELKGYEKRKISELSGGQKQRVAIARAIVKDPEMIFADEPTGALDEETGKGILSLLKGLSSDRLVIVVTHDEDFAREYGDRIIELKDGRIIRDTGMKKRHPSGKKPLRIIKPHLPIKTAAKVGLGNFKSHPIRLVFAVFLSAISFTLFLVPITFSLWDSDKAFVDAVYDNNIQSFCTWKQTEIPWGSGLLDESLDQYLGAKSHSYVMAFLTDKEIEKIQSFVSVPYLMQKWDQYYEFQNQFYDLNNKLKFKEYQNLADSSEEAYSIMSSGYVYTTEEAEKYYGFQVFGRLPENEDEIAIPESVFHSFTFFGMLDEHNEFHEIQTYDDILGLKINFDYDAPNKIPCTKYLTISGVVETGCNRECKKADGEFHKNFHNKFFVPKSVINREKQTLYFQTPKDRSQFEALWHYISKYRDGDDSYALFNDASRIQSSNDGGRVTMMGNLCLYVGILFFLISFLFLTSFIGKAIRDQLKQIGILKAMGLSTNGILKIYGTVSGFVCAATSIFSGIGSVIAGIFLNDYFTQYFGFIVKVMQFHILTPIFLVSSLVLVSMFGCFIPILRYRRKSTAEIIQKGQIK